MLSPRGRQQVCGWVCCRLTGAGAAYSAAEHSAAQLTAGASHSTPPGAPVHDLHQLLAHVLRPLERPGLDEVLLAPRVALLVVLPRLVHRQQRQVVALGLEEFGLLLVRLGLWWWWGRAAAVSLVAPWWARQPCVLRAGQVVAAMASASAGGHATCAGWQRSSRAPCSTGSAAPVSSSTPCTCIATSRHTSRQHTAYVAAPPASPGSPTSCPPASPWACRRCSAR
jgi:hypothetical protein